MILKFKHLFFLCVLAALFLTSAPLHASIRRGVTIDAPFFPYANINYLGTQSNISHQQYTVKKGEIVEILATDSNHVYFKVKLKDGSLGYIPGFFFIKNGLIYNFGPGYSCVETGKGLTEGKYRIVNMIDWVPNYGPNAYKLEIVTINGKTKYTLNISGRAFTSFQFNFISALPKEFLNLPVETPVKKAIFMDTKGLGYATLYKGISETKLISMLGEPDAIIAASRSKYGKKELLFKNVFYPDKNNTKYAACGIVCYMKADGTVESVKENAWNALPLKDLKTSEPPFPDGVSENDIKALRDTPEKQSIKTLIWMVGILIGIILIVFGFTILRKVLLNRGNNSNKGKNKATFRETVSGDYAYFVGSFLPNGDFKTDNGRIFKKQTDGNFKVDGSPLLFRFVSSQKL